MHRKDAFFLREVIAQLRHDVIVYNVEDHHPSLRAMRGVNVVDLREHGHGFDPPFRVKTRAHTTRKYANVNVVKTQKRKEWWTNENKDFLAVCRDLRDNHRAYKYLIVEDDNVFRGSTGILPALSETEPIVHMGLGTGAMMMTDEFLEGFIGFLSLRVNAQPIDWLIELYMDEIGRDLVHDNRFEHVGGRSSTKPDQVDGKF